MPSYPDVGPVRLHLSPHCVFLRTTTLIDDVPLLRAVSEAFKHFHLDRPGAMILDANSVIMLGSGWGEMRYGEGKYGGAEQVLVVRKTGEKRALSSILQNVFDAWLTLIGQTATADRSVLRDGMDDLDREMQIIFRTEEEQAQQYLSDPSSVDAVIADRALPLAAINGDEALFNQVLEHLKTAPTPEIAARYRNLIPLFRDPKLIARAVDYIYSDQIRSQDLPGMAGAPCRSHNSGP